MGKKLFVDEHNTNSNRISKFKLIIGNNDIFNKKGKYDIYA